MQNKGGKEEQRRDKEMAETVHRDPRNKNKVQCAVSQVLSTGQNRQYNFQGVKVYLGSQPLFILFCYFWLMERQTIPLKRGGL